MSRLERGLVHPFPGSAPNTPLFKHPGPGTWQAASQRRISFEPNPTAMGQEIFEARWNSLSALRAIGHMELEDFMGVGEDLAPLVDAGLLVFRDLADEWQRYGKLVPTQQGERFLVHDAHNHLIMVKRTQLGALSEMLRRYRGEPAPVANPIPVMERLQRVDRQLAQAHDTWSLVRLQEMRRWVQKGYMDLDHFKEMYHITDERLISSWTCEKREKPGRHGSPLVPMLDGMLYLKRVDAWDLVLVKPGMEEALVDHCLPGMPGQASNA